MGCVRMAIMETLTAIMFRHREKLRFLTSGGIAFSVNISFLYLLTDVLGVWYLFSSMLASISAFFVSFTMQKFWTFQSKDKKGVTKELFLTLLLVLFNLCVNTVLMYLFVEYIHLHYITAQIVAAIILAIETYFVYKHFIFKLKTTSN